MLSSDEKYDQGRKTTDTYLRELRSSLRPTEDVSTPSMQMLPQSASKTLKRARRSYMVVSVALRTKRSGLHLIFRCRYVRKGPLSDPARSSS
jgi:hypothetical protein